MCLSINDMIEGKRQEYLMLNEAAGRVLEDIKILQCQLVHEKTAKMEESKKVFEQSLASLKHCIVSQPGKDPLYGAVIREVAPTNGRKKGNLIVMVGNTNKPTETFTDLLSVSPQWVTFTTD